MGGRASKVLRGALVAAIRGKDKRGQVPGASQLATAAGLAASAITSSATLRGTGS